MDRIRPMLTQWPEVLPSRDQPRVVPLAIGIDRVIAERVVAVGAGSREEAQQEVAKAIRFLTRSFAYRRALAAEGAMRHDVNGVPVEPVAPEHAQYARVAKAQLPAAIQKETISVKDTGIRIAVPFSPNQLKPVAETVKTVDLTLDL